MAFFIKEDMHCMKNRWIKMASLLLLILLMAGVAAVSVPALAEAAATKPKSVSLNTGKVVQLPLGSTLTLNPTVSPAGATTTFTWKSSKRKVATVSGGVVTPKKTGTTTITCTTGNKKKAKVKVKVIDPYKPASIRFNATGPLRMPVYSTLQLTATMTPETAQSALKWKSSNRKVASVNANGVISAHIPGKATITCTTRNKKKAKIKVQVYDDGQQPITTTPDYNLPYVIYACKKSHTIAVIARDETGAWTRVLRTWPTGIGRNPKNTDVGTFFLRRKERWHRWGSGYSPYANRLSVGLYLHGPIFKGKNHNSIRPLYYNLIGKNCSSGCLRTTTACSGWIYYNCPKGTQIIVAQNSRFSAPRPPKIGKKAKKDPTDPGTFEVLMTGFTVSPGAMTLDQGAALGIVAGNFAPAGTTTNTFTYESRNPGVATVSPDGVVTGVGGGTTEIVVTANDDFRARAVVSVTVNAASAAKLAEAQAVEDIPDATAFEEDALEAVEAAAAELAVADEIAVEAPAGEVAVETPAAEAVVETAPEAVTDAAQTADETGDGDFFFDETEPVAEDVAEVAVEGE